MSEIKTPVKELQDTQSGDLIHVITENHTFADIIRFLIDQGCDKIEAETLYEMEERDE